MKTTFGFEGRTDLSGRGLKVRQGLENLFEPLLRSEPARLAFDRLMEEFSSSRLHKTGKRPYLQLTFKGHRPHGQKIQVRLFFQTSAIGEREKLPKHFRAFLELFSGWEIYSDGKQDNIEFISLDDLSGMQESLIADLEEFIQDNDEDPEDLADAKATLAHARKMLPFLYSNSDYTGFHQGFVDNSGDSVITTIFHDQDRYERPTDEELAGFGFPHWFFGFLQRRLGTATEGFQNEIAATARSDRGKVISKYLASTKDKQFVRIAYFEAYKLWQKDEVPGFLEVVDAIARYHPDASTEDGERFLAQLGDGPLRNQKSSAWPRIEAYLNWLSDRLRKGEPGAHDLATTARHVCRNLDPAGLKDKEFVRFIKPLYEQLFAVEACDYRILKEIESAWEGKAYQQVLSLASKAITAERHDPFYYQYAVWALKELDRPAELIETGQTGLSYFPQDMPIADMVIGAQASLGQYQDAIELFHGIANHVDPSSVRFSNLMRTDTKFPNMLRNTIACYVWSGSTDNVLANLEAYFSLDYLTEDRFGVSAGLAANIAGLYAINKSIEESVTYIKKSLELGMEPTYFQQDSDFDGIRDTPEFKQLLGSRLP